MQKFLRKKWQSYIYSFWMFLYYFLYQNHLFLKLVKKKEKFGGAWLAQSGERGTLDLPRLVVSSSPILGIEIT